MLHAAPLESIASQVRPVIVFPVDIDEPQVKVFRHGQVVFQNDSNLLRVGGGVPSVDPLAVDTHMFCVVAYLLVYVGTEYKYQGTEHKYQGFFV